MNRLMTGWRDEAWRKRVARLAVAAAPDGHRARILDVATGTGDLAFAMEKLGGDVTGIDFSTEMIAAAKRKAEKANSKVTFVEGDAMDLPFADGTFDACTVSFGLRNMPDYDAALASMMRILRPGGQLVCLEMTPFHRPVLGPLFKVYFERVMPLVGGLLSGAPSAYRYLPKSVEAFPSAHDLAERMKEVGLADVSYALYGFGTVAIHQGRRPV
jgi:demethylmenaquinone methyltransferase/2-methoxy-6-polyprenyl-1,4-benzoquinol methylase